MAIASRTQKSAKTFTGWVPSDKDYDGGGNGGRTVQEAGAKELNLVPGRFPG